MPLPLPYGDTVTVLRRTVTGQDGDGNDVCVWTPSEVRGCAVYPGDSNGAAGNEETQGQATIFVGLTVLMPYSTQITGFDRLRIRGELYEVYGEPGFWRSPLTGHQACVQVAATRVTGSVPEGASP